jgi:diguanylate cyclase (GGDEF)-like protein
MEMKQFHSAAAEQLQNVSELERLRLALASAGEVVYDSFVSTDEIVWGENAEEEFARNGLDVFTTRKEFLSLVAVEGAAALAGAIDGSIREDAPYCVTYQVRLPQGGACWIEDRGSCVCDETGRLSRVVGVLRFVTEQKERESRLAYLAAYDDHTGLINRTRLRAELSKALEGCWNDGMSGGFLVIGIDELAHFNENFGYDMADDLILEVGQRLKDQLTSNDVLSRVSGNKFGVILSNQANDHVYRIVQELKSSIQEHVIYTKAGPVSVTVSIGYVLLPGGARTSQEAMANAEEALWHAKASGRDHSLCFEASDERQNERRTKMKIADQINSAMNEDRVMLNYQPIVCAVSETVDFYECLIRIADANGDLIPAYKFIPVAEELGLVRALDKKVLDLAVGTLKKYPDLHLSLNVSGLTTTDVSWAQLAVRHLGQDHALASRLTVEITETVALQDMSELKNFVAILREMGCKVAIDDFGAGYTSYRNLKALDVDMVKIDGDFVKGLESSTDNQFYVKALTELAHNFNLKTVAECVETAEEAEVLRGLGVDLLQGYHYSKPLESPTWNQDEESLSA